MAEENKTPTRTDIVINGSTATWAINMTGDIQGLYTGTFVFRCYLSPTQRLAASREYRQLLGENPLSASQHDDDLAFSVSQLKHRILQSPPFWSSMNGEIPEHEVIMAILQAAVDAELIFRAQAKQKRIDSLERALALSKGLIDKQAKVEENKEE